MEIWKNIKDFEGLYQVSNFGRVRSLNYRHTGKVKVLSQGEHRNGYLYVILYKNGKGKKFYIHRLVAEAFIPNLLCYREINHIDEDKHNNHITNIEYCDRKYNNNYGTRNYRVTKKLINGKLSKSVLQLTKTGELVREWPSAMEAGRNGFHQGNITSCCRGERKTHKGFRWKFKKEVV